MGIYLPNMEMPTSCIACLLNFGEKRPEYGLTIYCPYSDGVISWRDKAFDNGRLASCGIVPVPPHGRLGDLDDLKERVTKRLYSSNHGSMAEAYYAALIDLIDTAPTIIEAEEGE